MTGSTRADSRQTTASQPSMPSFTRILYRIRQFWHTLAVKPSPGEIEPALAVLSSAEFALFSRLQPSEQYHSLQVLARLQQQEQTQPELLVAALLHDVGKSRLPLAAWERVLIVLANSFFPTQSQAWGQADASRPGLKKAFIVAARHPQWGAEMAEKAGSQVLTVNLIRRHQEPAPVRADNLEDQLLCVLQAADDET